MKHIGAMHAEKISEAVLLYVLKIAFFFLNRACLVLTMDKRNIQRNERLHLSKLDWIALLVAEPPLLTPSLILEPLPLVEYYMGETRM